MTLGFGEALMSLHYWLILLATTVMVGASIVLHYEALERLNQSLPSWHLHPRPRVLLAIVVILLVHIAEIWIFGLGIYVTVQFPEMGRIEGVDHLLLLDAVYLSASTFTTVGYGDLVPEGAIRLIFGTEALTGFVLITWSASFTYLEMQRYWKPR